MKTIGKCGALAIFMAFSACGGGGGDDPSPKAQLADICAFMSDASYEASGVKCRVVLMRNTVNGRPWPEGEPDPVAALCGDNRCERIQTASGIAVKYLE